MIVYGTTMQGRDELVPKEVAAWLRVRNALYPAIDFEISVHKISEAERSSEYESLAQNYARLYTWNDPVFGIISVSFPYLSEMWHVKIIGGADEQGNIVDRSDETLLTRKPLGAKLRAEIAGAAADSGFLPELVTPPNHDNILALPRTEKGAQIEPEMVPLTADFRYTSEFSISAAEFNKLFADPSTREEVMRAIEAKDWEALKKLKEKRQ